MQLVGIIPESGEVLTHYHHMFNKTDTSCCQIKMGTVAYLGGDHHMFNKTDTTCNMSMWVWWRTWVLCRPCKLVPDIVIIFLCIASITSNIETMQPRPFEEWIEKGHQRDANLCGVYARPTNERSLVREKGGYNQGVQPRLFCILYQGVWGMWRVALSLATVGASPGVRPGQAVL